MKKFLFLYTEMAGYMLACMKRLAAEYNAEVHVVVYPVNAIAPFQFDLTGKNLFFYERKSLDQKSLISLAGKINPDAVICSGWIDKDYLELCRQQKSGVPTVLVLDNPWRNTLKQNIAAIFGPFWLKRYFTHCWAAGGPQITYAKKLGFSSDQIKDGWYSCDYDYFHRQYLNTRDEKRKSFPKKIIFVGRYAKLKGVRELWQAFVLFQQKHPCEWELWCLGKGDYLNEFPNHDKIRNFGFVQPSEMGKFIRETGVFILPAHYEHWGVVVHEFAAAGFPMICSTTTSAATTFLKEGHNGFFHEPCSVESLVKVFEKLLRTSDEELIRMSERSAELATHFTPDTWSRKALEFTA
jgi:glycosyltransferase involved in cell wall biosynthesis